jgi:hypothetical protein
MFRQQVGFSRLHPSLKPTGRCELGFGSLADPAPGLGQRSTRSLAGGVRAAGVSVCIATINFERPAASLAFTSVWNRLMELPKNLRTCKRKKTGRRKKSFV